MRMLKSEKRVEYDPCDGLAMMFLGTEVDRANMKDVSSRLSEGDEYLDLEHLEEGSNARSPRPRQWAMCSRGRPSRRARGPRS